MLLKGLIFPNAPLTNKCHHILAQGTWIPVKRLVMQPLRGVTLSEPCEPCTETVSLGGLEREADCSGCLCLLTSTRVYAKSRLERPMLALEEEQPLPGYKTERSGWKRRRSGILENTAFQSRCKARSWHPNGSFIFEAQIFYADVIQFPKLANILRTCNDRRQPRFGPIISEKKNVRLGFLLRF